MNTPQGQVPAIQRYKIGYHSDEWGVRSLSPIGIYDDAGPWVRYEDHAAALCRQHARIAELEAQLAAAGYTAADMATAAARGFRDGAASAMAGEPVAWLVCTEEGDPDMVFLDRLEACQYCEDDDPPKPLYLAAPPTAQAEGWSEGDSND